MIKVLFICHGRSQGVTTVLLLLRKERVIKKLSVKV